MPTSVSFKDSRKGKHLSFLQSPMSTLARHLGSGFWNWRLEGSIKTSVFDDTLPPII